MDGENSLLNLHGSFINTVMFRNEREMVINNSTVDKKLRNKDMVLVDKVDRMAEAQRPMPRQVIHQQFQLKTEHQKTVESVSRLLDQQVLNELVWADSRNTCNNLLYWTHCYHMGEKRG